MARLTPAQRLSDLHQALVQAAAQLADVSLPRFVTAADTGQVAVDAAALRGLVARGLVTLDGAAALDGVRVGGELTRLLAPCSSASLLAEVEWSPKAGSPT